MMDEVQKHNSFNTSILCTVLVKIPILHSSSSESYKNDRILVFLHLHHFHSHEQVNFQSTIYSISLLLIIVLLSISFQPKTAINYDLSLKIVIPYLHIN
jgi:hypothetical protein